MKVSQMRNRVGRRGFTMIEIIIAIVVAGLLAAIGIPAMARTLRVTRVNSATTTLVSDLELALSTGARLRRPVVVLYDAGQKRFYHVDWFTSTTSPIFERSFGSGDLNMETVTVSSGWSFLGQPGLAVFSNGLTNTQFTVTLGQSGYTRQVVVTRAGQIRIAP